MMHNVCDKRLCTGCMGCINVCKKKAISIVDDIDSIYTVIDQEKCVNCKKCIDICPNNNPPKKMKPIYWRQGWAEENVRKSSSSGGAASALMSYFINSGGYVASCIFEDGEFCFKISNDIETIKKYAGSKYVKSQPGDIYNKINELLSQGSRVLFIGLPCQVAALKNVCGKYENLITVDLICHGTPSVKILRAYLKERGYEWNRIKDLKFRDNTFFGLNLEDENLTPKRVLDSYLLAFLACLNYTENCYVCNYASKSRVSDITLGDAWGQLSDIDPKGVSLILCQTEKGKELIESTGMDLRDVDLDLAIEANHQLRHPSPKHKGRDKYFRKIKNGYGVRKATIAAMPLESIKQSVKTGLIKLGIIHDFNDNRGGYRLTICYASTSAKNKNTVHMK